MDDPSIAKPVTENWENEGGSVPPVSPPVSYAESLGVASFMTETFVVGGYRYSNLADAIAQGRRMQRHDGPS